MLEQSTVSFRSNKKFKKGKNTFRFIAAFGFLSLILFLIIQKYEKDVFQNICDMVCMYCMSKRVLFFFLHFHRRKFLTKNIDIKRTLQTPQLI